MARKKNRRERRQFTVEFKAQAVRLVEVGGKTISQVARELDLTETALRNWVERARSEKQGGLTAERQELIRLCKGQSKRCSWRSWRVASDGLAAPTSGFGRKSGS